MKRELLYKYVEGRCSRAEIEQVLEYLQSRRGQEEFYQIMSEAEKHPDASVALDRARSKRMYERLQQSIAKQNSEGHKPLFPMSWRIAASVIMVIGTVLFTYRYRVSISETLFPVSYHELNVPEGYTGTLKLSDGTEVKLNSQAKIRYPETFRGMAERKVELQGEAYFSVTKNKAQPFVITTQKGHIKVLGTAFNVKEAPSDSSLIVAVTEGTVLLQDGRELLSGIRLGVGDIGILKDQTLRRSHTSHIENYLSWDHGEIAFRRASLAEVMRQLEHLYLAEIEVADPELNKRILTAKIKHGSLDYVIQEIATYLDLEHKKEQQKIILMSKP